MSEEEPTRSGPEMNVLRDAGGNILRLEWTKGGMYFSFNGDEVQPAIDAMTQALVSLGTRGGDDAVAITLFKTAVDAAPGDFV